MSEYFHLVEGDSIHTLARDRETAVAAHIVIPVSKNNPQIIVAFPAGESSVSFRTSDALWELKEIAPYLDRSKGQHGVEFRIRCDRKKVKVPLRWTILDNILNLRHVLYYSSTHEDYPKYLDRDGDELVLTGKGDKVFLRNLERIPIRILEKLLNGNHIDLNCLRRRNLVRMKVVDHLISSYRETLDGSHRYELDLKIPQECHCSDLDNNGEIEIQGRSKVEILVRASTDFRRPTPIPIEEALSPEVLKAAKQKPRFYENLRNFSALTYQEKLLAGSWFYLVYFGRDTMNAARLMWRALSKKTKEVVILSVLNRISDDGTVSVVEELNDWPIRLAVSKFNGEATKKNVVGAAEVLEGILQGKHNIGRVYNVLDATFMLPTIAWNFLSELSVTERKNFLKKKNKRKESNAESLLRNIAKIISLIEPYVRSEDPRDLVRLVDSAGEVGNWRDSGQGIAWGKYPADINIALSLSAFESAPFIVRACQDSLGEAFLETLAGDKGLTALNKYLKDRKRFSLALSALKNAKRHFFVHLSTGDIRARLERYLRNSQIDLTEKRMVANIKLSEKIRVKDFLVKGVTPESIKDGLTFPSISLNGRGTPLPVMHSDEVYTLLDSDLPESETKRIINYIFLPYPIGLMSEVGMFVSNPIYQTDKELWGTEKFAGLGRNSYHGSVVWGWPMRALTLGLLRQIQFGLRSGFPENTIKKLARCVKLLRSIEEKVGRLTDSELWTWEPDPSGRMKPIAFGIGRSQPSTPVQLWSGSAGEIVLRETLALCRKRYPGKQDLKFYA